jgi:hypothetical protein
MVVDVFPAKCALPDLQTQVAETRAISITSLEEYSDMRRVVEIGTTCADTIDSLDHVVASFRAQCASTSATTSDSCVRTALLAYYRTARSRIHLAVDGASGSSCVHAYDDPTLRFVPMHDETAGAVFMAWLRLLLILTAAAIVWLRSTDADARADIALQACVLRAVSICDASTTPLRRKMQGELGACKSLYGPFSDTQQLVLGMIACIGRLIVALMRSYDMGEDALVTPLTSEKIAATISIVHCGILVVDALIRKFCLHAPNESRRIVIAALGGSSAVVDIACATMIAFTDTPVRGGTDTFDSVARLLTAVLLTLVCACRCTFSCACCGALGQTGNTLTAIAAGVGVFFWIVQSISVAVVLVYLFVIPTAMGWAQFQATQSTLISTTVFFGITLLAGPRTAQTAKALVVAVADARAKRNEESSSAREALEQHDAQHRALKNWAWGPALGPPPAGRT